MPRQALKQKTLCLSALIALGALALVSEVKIALAAAPELGGTYQCKPDPRPCLWPGDAPSISQNGNKLDIKSEKGEAAAATLTSDVTISVGGPMNSIGVIRPDHSIEWSDGTKWRKK